MVRLNTIFIVISVGVIAFNILYVLRPITILYFPQDHEWGLSPREGTIGMAWYGYNANALATALLATGAAAMACRLAKSRLQAAIPRALILAACAAVVLSFIVSAAHSVREQKKWFEKMPGAVNESRN